MVSQLAQPRCTCFWHLPPVSPVSLPAGRKGGETHFLFGEFEVSSVTPFVASVGSIMYSFLRLFNSNTDEIFKKTKKAKSLQKKEEVQRSH